MILLVVDCQNGLVTPELYQYDIFCHRVKALISAARTAGTEVVYVRHDDGAASPLTPGNPDYEISPLFAPRPGDKIIDKKVNSPFRRSGLLKHLRTKHEKAVMVVGLQTDFCIDAAVKCGFEHGLKIIVPEYTNSTVDNALMTAENSYNYYNHFLWKDRYARIVSFDEAMRLISEP